MTNGAGWSPTRSPKTSASALQKARALKPSIPLIGMKGIPLRDEIELESFLP
jgi:hypothetical protein